MDRLCSLGHTVRDCRSTTPALPHATPSSPNAPLPFTVHSRSATPPMAPQVTNTTHLRQSHHQQPIPSFSTRCLGYSPSHKHPSHKSFHCPFIPHRPSSVTHSRPQRLVLCRSGLTFGVRTTASRGRRREGGICGGNRWRCRGRRPGLRREVTRDVEQSRMFPQRSLFGSRSLPLFFPLSLSQPPLPHARLQDNVSALETQQGKLEP